MLLVSCLHASLCQAKTQKQLQVNRSATFGQARRHFWSASTALLVSKSANLPDQKCHFS